MSKPKLSEQVQNQIRVSERVAASARTHGPAISPILAAYAEEVQGPETKATVEAFQTVFGVLADGLDRRTAALRETELALAGERADDGPVRATRDQKAAALTALLSQLRRAVDDHLGADALATYGLATESPRVPAKLLQYGINVARQLGEFPRSVVSPLGTTFDTKLALDVLKTHCKELEAAVADDHREARELETALAARNRATAAWSDTYQGTASSLEGLYRLAGYRDLAEKVRPTHRKLRGEEEGPELDVATPDAD
ncbi:hypothetical protein [Polyangium spumosum]|uniref:Uncharacterized protein n=1 Tax=Polyangium spumosum TaxID=889282 RepID=A0A6N7Q314_9BACT|nr:hypothetical protein [Polyangium spumosum]MRG97220.1 hypothetical protein [Polyangium spumosum]